MGLFDNPWHILIVLLVLVLLFGSAKLPKAAKSMGEAMRIFKKEAQKLHEDDTPQVHAAPQQLAPAAQPVVQQPAAQQPVVQQPAAQPPYLQQPYVQQPIVQQPAPPPAAPQPVTPQPGTTNQPG
jgi:sec-independent protein translocase protein TatA